LAYQQARAGIDDDEDVNLDNGRNWHPALPDPHMACPAATPLGKYHPPGCPFAGMWPPA
jgi:hypothetical protein